MTDPDFDSIGYLINESPMFRSLCDNDEFSSEMKGRLVYLSEEVFSDENIDEAIDWYIKNMADHACECQYRFGGSENYSDSLLRHVSSIRNFFINRHEYIETVAGQ